MLEKLQNLLNNSYSPYYKFRVSCILLCNDGTLWSGVNVETSSPNSSICAERNAIYSAVSNGYKKNDFKEMHVMLDNDNGGYPCFVCRQTLSDLTNHDMDIYLYSKNKLMNKIKVKELIPYPFSKDDIV